MPGTEALSPSELEVDRPPLKVTDADRVIFHMAEFNALKSEIAELVKQTNTSMTFAITTSAAISAWLLSNPEAGWWARWLPFTVSALFGCLAGSYYIRIGNKSDYLGKIEQKLAAKGLGWEAVHHHRPKLIGAIYTLCWGALNTFGLVVAFYFDRLVVAPKV